MSDQSGQPRGGAIAPTSDRQAAGGRPGSNGSHGPQGTQGPNGSGKQNGHHAGPAGNGTHTAATLDAFYGPNAGYVLELYDRYLVDPSTVDPATRDFFTTVTPETLTLPTAGAAPAATPLATGPAINVRAVVGAVGLANSIREYGHLAVRLDPLGSDPTGAPELAAESHGMTEAELAALPADVVEGPAAAGAANAQEAIARLRAIYQGAIGYDFDHVQVA